MLLFMTTSRLKKTDIGIDIPAPAARTRTRKPVAKKEPYLFIPVLIALDTVARWGPTEIWRQEARQVIMQLNLRAEHDIRPAQRIVEFDHRDADHADCFSESEVDA